MVAYVHWQVARRNASINLDASYQVLYGSPLK
jgi:hypothetical protein